MNKVYILEKGDYFQIPELWKLRKLSRWVMLFFIFIAIFFLLSNPTIFFYLY